MITIIVAVTLFAISPVNSSAQDKSGSDEYTQSDTLTANSSQSESVVDKNISWFTRIGGKLDFSSGLMVRYTNSSKVDLVGTLSSVFLTAGTIDLQAGIFDRYVIDFSYERPLVKTRYSSEALSYRKNTSHGMEKYTFGVDIGPIFKLIVPGQIPWVFRRVLSMRFRTERELLQTPAVIGENTLFVTEETELTEGRMEESDFDTLPDNSSLSFNQRYNYYSADFPIILFNSRKYDFSGNDGDAFRVDELPGDQHSFVWIGTGISRWNFVDPARLEVPELGGRSVMLSVHNEVWAANLEATFKTTNLEVGGIEYRGESITRAGYGISYKVSNPHVDIDRFVELSEKTKFGTGSRYLESTHGIGVNLLSNSKKAKLYVTPQVTFRQIKLDTSAKRGTEDIWFVSLNIDLMV